MEGSDRELIERMAWLFNRMLEPDDTPYREELARVWADEQEIVPMRAALEGNVYRGPDAYVEFREASMEAWSELELEVDSIDGDGPRYLCSARLRGRGRESGAEFNVPTFAVIDIADRRVTRVATFLDREAALADFGSSASPKSPR